MNSPATDLKDVLVAAGIGVFAATSGWAIYISREPTSPDTVVTLFDTGGFPPSPKWLQDQPTIQVRVRGSPNGYTAAYAKALAARDALLGLPGQTINGTKYVGVWAMGDVTFLEYDANSRPIFVCNFRIVREPASGTYRS